MRNRTALLTIAWFTGCSRDVPAAGHPDPVHTTPPAQTTPNAGSSEVCDGVDNDLDGDVDEGCTATGECALDLAEGPPDPTACWAVTATVQKTSGPDGPLTTAGMGQLTDDDGDGTFGPGDDPDFVLEPSLIPYHVQVIDPAGVVELDLAGQYVVGTMIGDVTGDGVPELIAIHILAEEPTGFHHVVEAWHGDGTQVWTSPDLPPTDGGRPGMPTAGDVDGDGQVEVVAGAWVLDGATGALERRLALPTDYGGNTVLVDLDGDGALEIVEGNAVFGQGTDPLWSGDPGDGHPEWSYPIPLQLDADPEVELGFYGDSTLSEYDTDGTPLGSFAIPVDRHAGAPCVADFDGDGVAEIALPGRDGVAVVEQDGTLLWEATAKAAGCSAADLDLDGAADLILTGDDGLVVLDGPTGAERIAQSGFYGQSAPAIVDLDGDGDAEIVASSYDYTGTVPSAYIVLDAVGWPGVGTQWSMPDFSEDRLSESGVLGAGAVGALRSRPTVDLGGPPPVTAELADACANACTAGAVRVAVQLHNRGPREVTPTLEIVGVDGDGVERVTGTLTATLAGWSTSTATADVEAPGDVELLYARVAGGSMCDLPPTPITNPCTD